MTLGLVLLAAYLLGSIPMSWLMARLGGIDLRAHGSGNLGATNLYRALGWRYAIPAGLFDVAKGVVPVMVLAPRAGNEPWIPLLTGATAMFGHVYSVFVRFKGGKGVATAAGVVLALAPAALLASVAVWLVVLKGSGYMSLASLAGAAAFPVAVWFVRPENPYVLWVGIVLAAFIWFTHRSNIRRLIAGTESRLGRRREV
ncbi:MAG TPA: glycerol-3-phosphate 1-O-acyltransferase PlsY [Gemmatimonadales bacterium]